VPFSGSTPPKINLSPATTESRDCGVWREGSRLIIRPGATLPHACIKCAQPTTGRGLRKTYFSQPSRYFRFLPFPFSFVVLLVSLIMGKRMTIEIPLCPLHRRRRMIGVIFTSLFCGGGLVTIAVGLNSSIDPNASNADNAPAIILTGIALMMIGGLCFVCAGRLLSPKQINTETATFAGAGAQFLQLLPDSPNPRP
jgi:hypothetical protein